MPTKLTKNLAGTFLIELRIKRCQRIIVFSLALILGGVCCSKDQIDLDDELGMENDNDGKVEIVIIDSTMIGSNGRDRESSSGIDFEYGDKEEEVAGSDLAFFVFGSDVIAYDPEGAFTVQVGVFTTAREAGKMVLTLSSMGYPAYSIAQPDGKGFRVRIGYFVNRDDAVSFGEIYKEDFSSDYWIDRRTNEF